MPLNHWCGFLIDAVGKKVERPASRTLFAFHDGTQAEGGKGVVELDVLKKPRMTWARFAVPDTGHQDGHRGLATTRLASRLAKELKCRVWFVAYADYGASVVACDKRGKERWAAAYGEGGPNEKLYVTEYTLAGELADAPKGRVRAELAAKLASAVAKTPFGKLNAELGIDFGAIVSHFSWGAPAKGAVLAGHHRKVEEEEEPVAPLKGKAAWLQKWRRAKPGVEELPCIFAGSDADWDHLIDVGFALQRDPSRLLDAAWALGRETIQGLPAHFKLPTTRHGTAAGETVQLPARVLGDLKQQADRLQTEPAHVLFAAWLIAAPALDPSRPAPSAPDPQWLNLQRQQLTAWRDADRLARADFRGAPDRSREIFYLAPSAIEWLELAAMAAKQYAEQAVERAWAKQSPGLRRARVLQVLPEVSTVPYDLFLKHKVFAAFDELAEKKGVSTGDLVALLFPSPSA